MMVNNFGNNHISKYAKELVMVNKLSFKDYEKNIHRFLNIHFFNS